MLRISISLLKNRIRCARIRTGSLGPSRITHLQTVAFYSHGNPGGLTPGSNNPPPDKKKKEKKTMTETAISAIKGAVVSVVDMIKNPKETWKSIKEVANHYWLGSKLLWSDIKVAKHILGRVLEGQSMTRRERLQLVRTTTDIFRLVPFSIFIIVPFMELLLPFALKLFPNMLPSTFQDSLKAEESMKKELQMRLAVANFMQETLQQMAEKKSSSADNEAASGAREVIEFVEKARKGEHIPNEQVVRIAKLFQDELTLGNVTRPQLVSMCQYMGLQPYGADSFLRFQLRSKLRTLQEDDRRILWEGIDSLNTIELRDACRERGMRSIGMTQFRLKKQLEEWLELSTQKGIPIFLLIMSRAFMLNSSGTGTSTTAVEGRGTPAVLEPQPSDPEQVLKSGMSFLNADTINEVVLNAASRGEVDTADMRRRRLESIQFQTEMMDGERQEREGAAKAQKDKPTAREPAAENHHNEGVNAAVAAAHTHIVVEDAARAEEVFAAAAQQSTQKQSKPTDGSAAAADDQLRTAPAALPSGVVSLLKLPSPLRNLSKSEDRATDSLQDQKELTIHELVALGDLARGNSLRREMSELAVLEAFIESLPIDSVAVAAQSVRSSHQYDSSERHPEMLVNRSATSSSSDYYDSDRDTEASESAVQSAESQKEDKSVAMMKSVISSMVSTLKVKINTTEKVLGDKLKVLDQDGDGEISLNEIKDVVATVLKKGSSSEEQVSQMFQVLDSNKDGKVSVAELLYYIQKKKEHRELELLEMQKKAAADAARAAESGAPGSYSDTSSGRDKPTSSSASSNSK